MAEYIDRTDLIKNLNKFAPEHYTALINQLIMKQPTADVVEVKHGEWKKIECGTICTNCNRVYDNDFEFSYKQINEYFKQCPECGAKMDGGKA